MELKTDDPAVAPSDIWGILNFDAQGGKTILPAVVPSAKSGLHMPAMFDLKGCWALRPSGSAAA